MHEREKVSGKRCADNPYGLIIPVVIDDGDCFPPEVQAMQPSKFHDFANPFMRPDSPRQEQMADKIREDICDAVEAAINQAPSFDAAWETIAHKQFEGVFHIQTPSQSTLPSLRLPIS